MKEIFPSFQFSLCTVVKMCINNFFDYRQLSRWSESASAWGFTSRYYLVIETFAINRSASLTLQPFTCAVMPRDITSLCTYNQQRLILKTVISFPTASVQFLDSIFETVDQSSSHLLVEWLNISHSWTLDLKWTGELLHSLLPLETSIDIKDIHAVWVTFNAFGRKVKFYLHR